MLRGTLTWDTDGCSSPGFGFTCSLLLRGSPCYDNNYWLVCKCKHHFLNPDHIIRKHWPTYYRLGDSHNHTWRLPPLDCRIAIHSCCYKNKNCNVYHIFTRIYFLRLDRKKDEHKWPVWVSLPSQSQKITAKQYEIGILSYHSSNSWDSSFWRRWRDGI